MVVKKMLSLGGPTFKIIDDYTFPLYRDFPARRKSKIIASTADPINKL